MGTSNSSLIALKNNKCLIQLSSDVPISPNDPFWNQLLSFSFSPPDCNSDGQVFEEHIKPMLETLLSNNPITGNVVSLFKVFLMHSVELKDAVQCKNNVFIWQAYNSLFILRCIVKYFIEMHGEEGVIKQLEDVQVIKSSPTEAIEPEQLLESVIDALMQIIVEIPLDSKTYVLTVEAVNMLIVLLSTQMFSTRPAHKLLIYKIIIQGKCSMHANVLVKRLLHHFCAQDMCPHCISAADGGSIIAGLASGLWNVLTLNYASKGLPNSKSVTILADQCLLLLLTLINHCTNINLVQNPYKVIFMSFLNINSTVTSELINCPYPFTFNYEILFKALCNNLQNDQTALLAYSLLHQKSTFRLYVAYHEDIQNFIVPLLKLLYNAHENNSHSMYMALIIVLILSEEDYFNDRIHNIVLKNPSWYSEKVISEVSLGSMIAIILMRTIKFNMARMHDKYLHTNCLAALANMSNFFQNLHPYACQKFINLLENFGKRFLRINFPKENNPHATDDDIVPMDLMQDLSVIEEVLRMLLEILNTTLTFQLRQNLNLLYTVLYKKEIFKLFRLGSTFEDIMQNIDIVLLFFSSQLENMEKNVSVLEVSEIIKSISQQWSKEKLKKMPELKFKYVEEGQPEEFFVPYLWSVIFHSSYISFNPKHILIFNPHSSSF